ncbi:membrane protein [Sulfurovum lithotrophicum]|uniref:Membrane protein n=1 Tax=Sulfurovum lithotrophicum TaxID=206403 RepID=A0A7U4RQW5_9BACT|nr:VTT domain-containing protein [Sulfurovum lithotrophicum]AKF25162.1 membrane protein [Sulfurovum lithotrophicum]
MDFSSLETWGYLAVAFFSFGGSLFIVAAAGVFSYMGHMDLTTALVVAMVANFMGDNFLFYLGKYHKKDIRPYFAKHKRKIALATLIMRKYGVAAIFIQKFLYGVKTLVPISMALSKFDFKKFIFFNIFATILFILTIGLSAYYASETIIAMFSYVQAKPWIAPLVAVAFLGSLWYAMTHFTKRR